VTDGGGKLAWKVGRHTGEMDAFDVQAIDTTGAGDAFVAGLLHQLVNEPSLLEGGKEGGIEEVVRFACACGAMVCQGPGAIDPQATLTEVHSFMAGRGKKSISL